MKIIYSNTHLEYENRRYHFADVGIKCDPKCVPKMTSDIFTRVSSRYYRAIQKDTIEQVWKRYFFLLKTRWISYIKNSNRTKLLIQKSKTIYKYHWKHALLSTDRPHGEDPLKNSFTLKEFSTWTLHLPYRFAFFKFILRK